MTTTKYIIRALKYLLLFIVLIGLALGFTYLTSEHQSDYTFGALLKSQELFLLVVLLLAAISPLMAYQKIETPEKGGLHENKQKLIDLLTSCGFVLTEDNGSRLTFRQEKKFRRIWYFNEDGITIYPSTKEDGYMVFDGRRQDVSRFARHWEYLK